MLTVHVRINDTGTGRPTPVRVRFLTPDGSTAVPFGRLASFATAPYADVGGHLLVGSERFCFVDGTCEIRLPSGVITVEASKGPEYSPLRREITLGPGKISMRLAVERWTDLRTERWYSGDTRATSLSPHAALVEAAAEDLAVVNLLALERPGSGDSPPALPNLLAFSGSVPALQTPGHMVAVNTLNIHPLLGAVALLNCHRVVYPLRFGGPDGADDWSVLDWCEQCHRKQGLVVWPDLPRLTDEHPQGEALAALLLGQIDAFEISRFADPEPAVLADWYRLLDCGLRLPLAGGSGKNSNALPLGRVRTYARLQPGEELSYPAWIEAVRAGRTFASNAPLLFLTVDDQDPGTVISTASTGKTVKIRAEARSRVAFEQLELLVNGRIQASKTASGNRQSAILETEATLTESAWIAARCWSRETLPGEAGQCVYAHTSPVYVQVEGKPIRPTPDTTAPLLRVLDRTQEWARGQARCETEKQRAQLVGVFEAARQNLLRRAE
jgi:hypothetical protein